MLNQKIIQNRVMGKETYIVPSDNLANQIEWLRDNVSVRKLVRAIGQLRETRINMGISPAERVEMRVCV